MRDFHHQASAGQCLLHEVAFQINIRIDFVRNTVVALIAFESDVVSCRADPDHRAVDGKGSFPNAKMVARRDHTNGFGVSPAAILLTAKKIQPAHRHADVSTKAE